MAAASDLALLADGRTAALVGADGNVAWLCWPQIDSDPCLVAAAAGSRGGVFSVRPRGEAELIDREDGPGLCLRSRWRQGRGTLTVDDALAWEGRPGLLRMLRAEGAPVLVEVRWRPAFGAGTAPVSLVENDRRAVAAGARLVLAVDAPAPWRIEEGVAISVFRLVPGYPAGVVLGDAGDAVGVGDAPERMAATRRQWRAVDAALTVTVAPGDLAVRALGAEAAQRAMTRSAAILVGLRQRGGSIPRAATTSLDPADPQDDRLARTADAALAARALLRLGLVEEAHGVAAACADAWLGEDLPPPALARVDETPAGARLEIAEGIVRGAETGLSGLGTAGALLDLAWDLTRARALPEALRRAVPRIAGWAASAPGAGGADGLTRDSVAAWSALRQAAALARAGAVAGRGQADDWEARSRGLRARILAGCVDAAGALTIRPGGADGDPELADAVHSGLLVPQDPRAAVTLASALRAAPGPLATQIRLAHALDRCGGDGARLLRDICATATAAGLLPMRPAGGNLPATAAHAAFVLAADARPAQQ